MDCNFEGRSPHLVPVLRELHVVHGDGGLMSGGVRTVTRGSRDFEVGMELKVGIAAICHFSVRSWHTLSERWPHSQMARQSLCLTFLFTIPQPAI